MLINKVIKKNNLKKNNLKKNIIQKGGLSRNLAKSLKIFWKEQIKDPNTYSGITQYGISLSSESESDVVYFKFFVDNKPYTGEYIVKLKLTDWPIKAPVWQMITPNGKFIPNMSLCLGPLSHFHSSAYSTASLGGLLQTFIGYFDTSFTETGVGIIKSEDDVEIEYLSNKSRDFNKKFIKKTIDEGSVDWSDEIIVEEEVKEEVKEEEKFLIKIKDELKETLSNTESLFKYLYLNGELFGSKLKEDSIEKIYFKCWVYYNNYLGNKILFIPGIGEIVFNIEEDQYNIPILYHSLIDNSIINYRDNWVDFENIKKLKGDYYINYPGLISNKYYYPNIILSPTNVLKDFLDKTKCIVITEEGSNKLFKLFNFLQEKNFKTNKIVLSFIKNDTDIKYIIREYILQKSSEKGKNNIIIELLNVLNNISYLEHICVKENYNNLLDYCKNEIYNYIIEIEDISKINLNNIIEIEDISKINLKKFKKKVFDIAKNLDLLEDIFKKNNKLTIYKLIKYKVYDFYYIYIYAYLNINNKERFEILNLLNKIIYINEEDIKLIINNTINQLRYNNIKDIKYIEEIIKIITSNGSLNINNLFKVDFNISVNLLIEIFYRIPKNKSNLLDDILKIINVNKIDTVTGDTIIHSILKKLSTLNRYKGLYINDIKQINNNLYEKIITNFKIQLNYKNYEGFTPLEIIVRYYYPNDFKNNLIKLLIDNDANITLTDFNEDNIFHSILLNLRNNLSNIRYDVISSLYNNNIVNVKELIGRSISKIKKSVKLNLDEKNIINNIIDAIKIIKSSRYYSEDLLNKKNLIGETPIDIDNENVSIGKIYQENILKYNKIKSPKSPKSPESPESPKPLVLRRSSRIASKK